MIHRQFKVIGAAISAAVVKPCDDRLPFGLRHTTFVFYRPAPSFMVDLREPKLFSLAIDPSAPSPAFEPGWVELCFGGRHRLVTSRRAVDRFVRRLRRERRAASCACLFNAGIRGLVGCPSSAEHRTKSGVLQSIWCEYLLAMITSLWLVVR